MLSSCQPPTANALDRLVRAAAVLVALLAPGCAVAKNTVAQDLAWERWQKCKDAGATVNLKEIRPDGQVWVEYYAHHGYAAFRDCMRRAAQAQAAGRPDGVSQPPPAAVTASVSSASAQPLHATVPVWKRGDEWAYRWETSQGAGTYVVVVDRVEAVDGTDYYVVKTGTRRETYYRIADLALYLEKVDGTVQTRWFPGFTWFVWPLTAGQTWEILSTRDNPKDRQTTELLRVCEVVTQETTTVPAGNFNTLRIACRDKRTGTLRSEVWYAPDAKQWVRARNYLDSGIQERELVKYRIQ
jgi:hypothetical protein